MPFRHSSCDTCGSLTFGRTKQLVFKCPKCGGTSFRYYTEDDLRLFRRKMRLSDGMGAVRV